MVEVVSQIWLLTLGMQPQPTRILESVLELPAITGSVRSTQLAQEQCPM